MCTAAGDKVSLAIGMTGLATELLYAGRTREAARLSSEQMALLESIGDPTPTMGLAPIAFCNWLGVGDFGQILWRSQTIVDLAAGDPAKGAGFGVGSPLAIALAWRGTARWWLGRPGWRQDLHDAVTMARRSNPETLSGAVAWTYGYAMHYGVLRVDDSILRASEEAVQTAQRASSDRALGLAAYTLAVGLLNRDAAADRHRGLELMMQTRDIWLRKRGLFLIPVTDVWAARETARRGDRDAAIPVLRQAVDELRQAETSSMACGAPAFWWRHCWSVAPRATWPKPKRSSTGWRTCGPIKIRRCATSGCCDCGCCSAGLAAMRWATGITGIATATWRNRLASKVTSTGPRQ